MPGAGINPVTTRAEIVPALLLDLTRSMRRAGRTATGIDRVELHAAKDFVVLVAITQEGTDHAIKVPGILDNCPTLGNRFEGFLFKGFSGILGDFNRIIDTTGFRLGFLITTRLRFGFLLLLR